jgi:hypothetical protein
MKKTITFNDFLDEFKGSQYENQFSYDGKRALFDYLEEVEGQDKEEIELDIVALCYEYTEYDNELSCALDYGFIPEETETTELIEKEAEQNEEARLWLEDRTQVIELENGKGIIIQQF